MNILYLDHAPIFGGAEVVLNNLITELDRNRWMPLVATSANASFRSALDQSHIEWIGMPSVRLNQSGFKMPIHLARSVYYVARIIRDRHIGMIHSNTVRTHVIGSLAAFLTRTPSIWTLHDNTFPCHAVKMLAPIPIFVICVSEWLRVLYAPQRLNLKTVVIHNGLDLSSSLDSEAGLRDELGIPLDAPFIVNVGRLVEGKAPHLFVQAARQVLRKYPSTYFAIVGGSDHPEPGQAPAKYPKQLAQVVKECGLGKQLIMTGRRSDIGRFYAAADALVYTAIQPEGLPTVLLEAMRYAVPVVASSIGGASEIVKDGVTGWCVPPNSVESLVDAMLRMLSNPEQARTLGVNGRSRLRDEFDLRRQVVQTQAIYEQLYSKVHR
ncbi:MAG: glycosyltransferase family 4 protein [Anaerolineae bacterium]